MPEPESYPTDWRLLEVTDCLCIDRTYIEYIYGYPFDFLSWIILAIFNFMSSKLTGKFVSDSNQHHWSSKRVIYWWKWNCMIWGCFWEKRSSILNWYDRMSYSKFCFILLDFVSYPKSGVSMWELMRYCWLLFNICPKLLPQILDKILDFSQSIPVSWLWNYNCIIIATNYWCHGTSLSMRYIG
jgi:hypothetical protein